MDVTLKMNDDDDEIEVSIDGQLPKGVKSTTIYFASVVREATVPIKRGENSNREITYTNVVRELKAIGMFHGESKKIMFPVNEVTKNNADSCAIIVQIDKKGVPGQILGAALY